MASSIFGYLSRFHVGPYTANRFGVAMAFFVGVMVKSVGYVTTVVVFALFRNKQVKNNALQDEAKSEDDDHVADIHESTDVEHSSPELMSVHEEDNVAESSSEVQETNES